jgi:hypothetical protein
VAEKNNKMVLISVELPTSVRKELSIASVAQYLGVQPSELDAEFGVVSVDPQRQLYAIMIAENRMKGVLVRLGPKAKGPFSDPEIGPFRPVEEGT